MQRIHFVHQTSGLSTPTKTPSTTMNETTDMELASPCRLESLNDAVACIDKVCGSFMMQFHATWTPWLMGIQYIRGQSRFGMLPCNWNPKYNIQGCLQMTHNYGGSVIKLAKKNNNLPVERRDYHALMTPYRDDGTNPTSNIESLVDLSPGRASTSNRTVPMTPLDVSEDWGHSMILPIKYLIRNDLRFEEARKEVAKTFDFSTEWSEKCAEFNDRNAYPDSVRSRRGEVFEMIKLKEFHKLLSKSRKFDRVMLHCFEGKHGTLGVVSTMFGEYFDPMTSTASERTALTYDVLHKYGLVERSAISDMSTTYLRELHYVMSTRKSIPMWDNLCQAKVYYLKRPVPLCDEVDLSIPKLLSNIRTISMSIADSKTTSNRTDAMSASAEFIRSVGVVMSRNRLKYTPRFDGDEEWITSPEYRTSRELDKATENLGVEKEADVYKFPKPGMRDILTKYADDPASADTDLEFLDAMTRPAKEDGDKRVRPPFVNSIKSLIVNPNELKQNAMTTSKVNLVYFGCKFLLWLYADYKKCTVDEAVRDKDRKHLTHGLVFYFISTAHVQSYSTVPLGLRLWYPTVFGGTAHFDDTLRSIVMAAKWMATLVDAALTHPGEHRDETTDARRGYKDYSSKTAKNDICVRLKELSQGVNLIGRQGYDVQDIIHNGSEYL